MNACGGEIFAVQGQKRLKRRKERCEIQSVFECWKREKDKSIGG